MLDLFIHYCVSFLWCSFLVLIFFLHFLFEAYKGQWSILLGDLSKCRSNYSFGRYVISSLICILCFLINGNTRIKATLCSIPKVSNRAYFFLCRVVLGAWILAEFISPFLHLIVTGIVVRNTLVTYDRENNKIGFWKTNCSELWMRLNYLSPPPPGPPLVFDSLNRTTEIPPSAAPHGSPDIVSPGRIIFKLGFCTLLKYW